MLHAQLINSEGKGKVWKSLTKNTGKKNNVKIMIKVFFILIYFQNYLFGLYRIQY